MVIQKQLVAHFIDFVTCFVGEVAGFDKSRRQNIDGISSI